MVCEMSGVFTLLYEPGSKYIRNQLEHKQKFITRIPWRRRMEAVFSYKADIDE